MMRVLAAAFEDPAAARVVLEELRHRYDLSPTDAGIAPLGTEDRSPDQTVIAGHFTDDVVPEFQAVVAAHGGVMVGDVDELWTRPLSTHESLEPMADITRH
jgi:hypothetical protein